LRSRQGAVTISPVFDPTSSPAEPVLRLREADLHWRDVEGEVIALDMARSEYVGLNRSGAPLWRALGTGATRTELVGLLRAEFALDAETAERDVDAFITQLRSQQLLADTASEA
jgi:hypothetical protein